MAAPSSLLANYRLLSTHNGRSLYPATAASHAPQLPFREKRNLKIREEKPVGPIGTSNSRPNYTNSLEAGRLRRGVPLKLSQLARGRHDSLQLFAVSPNRVRELASWSV
jgi:hypothetical protein